jgi:hypothetical protein
MSVWLGNRKSKLRCSGDNLQVREPRLERRLVMKSYTVDQLCNCTVKLKKIVWEKGRLFPNNLEETDQLHASVKWQSLLVNFCGNRPYQYFILFL